MRFLIFASFLITCVSSSADARSFSRPRNIQINLNEKFEYDLYLSDVACWIDGRCNGPVANYPQRTLGKKLEQEIRAAKDKVDFAIYGVRNQDWFINLIGSLRTKGISLRFTVDQVKGAVGDWSTLANFVYPDAIKLVEKLGVNKVQPDRNTRGNVRTNSIMHNKFFTIDDSKVWFGSTNLTDTEIGSEYNANASIMVRSKALAEIFGAEFRQMFEKGFYSKQKQSRHELPTYNYRDGTKVSVYFSPQERPIADAVIPFIKDARHTLDIGMFFLTSEEVAHALIDAHDRGVKIRIINDATGASSPYAHNNLMRQHGIDVRVENWGGKMHMKSGIRDGADVIIGSANWTKSADEQNDEHLVVIENNQKLAKSMEQYFENLWDYLESSLEPGYEEPRPEGDDSINSCNDGINNDHDNTTDDESPWCE